MSDVMHKIIGTLKGGGMHTVMNILEDPKLINKLNSGPSPVQEARSADEPSTLDKAQYSSSEIASPSSRLSISAKSKL